MFERLNSRFPGDDHGHLAALADVWSIELGRIVERMLTISQQRGSPALPIQRRPEAIFELAKLILWLEDRIVDLKTATTPIGKIDVDAERDALSSQLVERRVESTARNCAEGIWIKRCERWWKRFPLLAEPRPKHKLIRRRESVGHGVRDQHFSPTSSNEHWASDKKRVREYFRASDGTVDHKDVSVRKWGRESFLYSQRLERLFHLIEGDVSLAYGKLLGTIPLDEKDRRHWIAFLVAQLFRTPSFILQHLPRLKALIEKQGLNYPTDTASLRRAYETLFTNNRVFATMYRRLVGRQWEMWCTSGSGTFIRSDDPVLSAGSSKKGNWMLLYPMTPNKCFVAGPARCATPPDVVPRTRMLTQEEVDSHQSAHRWFGKALRNREATGR